MPPKETHSGTSYDGQNVTRLTNCWEDEIVSANVIWKNIDPNENECNKMKIKMIN